MKYLFLLLFPLSCLSQNDNLNKSLLEGCNAYKSAAAGALLAPKLIPIMKEQGTVLQLPYYINDTKDFYPAFMTNYKDVPCGAECITTVCVELTPNLTICFSVNPILIKGIPINNKVVEVAVMEVKNGETTELDYGIYKKNRIKSLDNTYLEAVTLKNGLSVIIKDNIYLYGFRPSAESDGSFYVPEYTFE